MPTSYIIEQCDNDMYTQNPPMPQEGFPYF